MKNSRAKDNADVIERSIDFEVTTRQMVNKSERKAWIIAACSCLLSIFLVIGYLFLLPLKEKVPYMVMADPYTGTSTLSKLTENFQNPDMTKNEAINKSNVSHYIISRESYDYDIVAKRDWVAVHSMSGPNVIKGYQDLYGELNALNPDKVYGRDRALRVKIKTIVLLAPDNTGNYTGATVRFDRLTLNKKTETIELAESFIATVSYDYKSNLKMPEDYRVEDPEFSAGTKALVLKEISNGSSANEQKAIAPTVPVLSDLPSVSPSVPVVSPTTTKTQ
jgi:type IV secretion system protein VirB8